MRTLALSVLLSAATVAGAQDYQLDAAAKKRVIETAIAKLDENYVFPAVATRMAESVRQRLSRGDYDKVSDGLEFARLLTTHFREISNDRHLRVVFGDQPQPGGGPRPQSFDDATACGFVTSEVQPGNIGYLKFNMFASVERCAGPASEAMTKLADTDALIIDLRDNGGGQPAMVAFLSSYLFDKRMHLNDIWTRRDNRTQEFWTRDVPGRKFGGAKPVYVLTARRTFSGAEEFSYNLKSLKRATIIGETTGGGAHPTQPFRIDDMFSIGVPFARAINPITKTNWEGAGVAPDVAVPASDALETARRMIRDKAKP
jgi:retinol-binding protein 3